MYFSPIVIISTRWWLMVTSEFKFLLSTHEQKLIYPSSMLPLTFNSRNSRARWKKFCNMKWNTYPSHKSPKYLKEIYKNCELPFICRNATVVCITKEASSCLENVCKFRYLLFFFNHFSSISFSSSFRSLFVRLCST